MKVPKAGGVEKFARLNTEVAKRDQRDPGARDRDRILHTLAFRRLASVTQVVGAREGYAYHNRLTHTLEAAQIARRLAEKLLRDSPTLAKTGGGIDPEIAEAATLAHDLGHPPFGHIAEHELDELARQSGDPDGFEGNAQSFRIVTRLAAHRDGYLGLNLTKGTLNAVLKYPWLRDIEDVSSKHHRKYGAYRCDEEAFQFARKGTKRGDTPSLEAQIMDLADTIAYSVHDVDDFQRSGVLPIDHLINHRDKLDAFLDLWRMELPELSGRIDSNRKSLEALLESICLQDPYDGSFTHRVAMRTMASNLIATFVYAIELRRSKGIVEVVMDPDREIQMRFLQRLTWRFAINHPSLITQQHGQRRAIRELFNVFLTAVKERDLALIPKMFAEDAKRLGKTRRGKAYSVPEIRLALDIVATLTDQGAASMFCRLTGVEFGAVTDNLFV